MAKASGQCNSGIYVLCCRPSNFRTKGDASRSGRLSNWRTAQLEDGGGEVWRNSPMSPGPKSPDKWHVVGKKYLLSWYCSICSCCI